MPLQNNRLLRTIKRQSIDCTPVWLMRQAGRYLPEYRALRAEVGSFMRLCKTPELACEVTLQPLKRYSLDAAILFSDILTIPDAMGLHLDFSENIGPYFANPPKTASEIAQLQVPDLAQLGYVYDAIRLIKSELSGRLPLIGFCGSPFTLSAYILEGRGKTGFPIVQKLMKDDPATLKRLLQILAESVASHLNAQVNAGADVIMIFDTWGGLLATPQYKEFSLFYIKKAIEHLHRYSHYNKYRAPIILFTRNGAKWLEEMAETGCDVLGVDWGISLTEARQRVGEKMILQGNLDPAVLTGNPQLIRDQVKQVLAAFGQGSGHIFNLGHGVTPDVPPENVALLIDAVHEESQCYHQHLDKVKSEAAL